MGQKSRRFGILMAIPGYSGGRTTDIHAIDTRVGSVFRAMERTSAASGHLQFLWRSSAKI